MQKIPQLYISIVCINLPTLSFSFSIVASCWKYFATAHTNPALRKRADSNKYRTSKWQAPYSSVPAPVHHWYGHCNARRFSYLNRIGHSRLPNLLKQSGLPQTPEHHCSPTNAPSAPIQWQAPPPISKKQHREIPISIYALSWQTPAETRPWRKAEATAETPYSVFSRKPQKK